MHKIGERIVSYRKQRNMSQEELATVLNVSRQTISKWETGDTLPDVYNAVALANLFNVSLDVLILGVNSKYSGSSYVSQLKENRRNINLKAIIIGSFGSTIFAVSMILLKALEVSDRNVGIIMACVLPVLMLCWGFAIWGFIKVGRINDEIKYLERLEMTKIQFNNNDKN